MSEYLWGDFLTHTVHNEYQHSKAHISISQGCKFRPTTECASNGILKIGGQIVLCNYDKQESPADARQHCHTKMAVSRHLGFYQTGNSVIRSADSENPCRKPNME